MTTFPEVERSTSLARGLAMLCSRAVTFSSIPWNEVFSLSSSEKDSVSRWRHVSGVSQQQSMTPELISISKLCRSRLYNIKSCQPRLSAVLDCHPVICQPWLISESSRHYQRVIAAIRDLFIPDTTTIDLEPGPCLPRDARQRRQIILISIVLPVHVHCATRTPGQRVYLQDLAAEQAFRVYVNRTV